MGVSHQGCVLSICFSQSFSPASNPYMTLRAIQAGDVIQVVVSDGDGSNTTIGRLKAPLELGLLAELLGTYEQVPEACGPLVDLGPPFDDGGLRVNSEGVSDWERDRLLASWAQVGEGASVHSIVSALSRATLRRIHRKCGTLLCPDLFTSFARVASRGAARPRRTSEDRVEVLKWLLARLKQAGYLMDVKNIPGELDGRLSCQLPTALLSVHRDHPRLVSHVISHMVRLEGHRVGYPRDGMHAPMGRGLYHGTLTWLQKTLSSVRRRSPDLGKKIPKSFQPLLPSEPLGAK